MNREINRWYKKLWETKGCRFIASERFDFHEKYSTLSLNIISVYVICINLLVLIKDRLKILSDTNITFGTICLSILIMIISLILYSRNYKGLSNKFHDCGKEISEIYDYICLLKNSESTPTQSQLESIIKNYNDLLKKYDTNHSKVDYDMFKSRNISEYNSITHPYLFKAKVNIQYFFETRLIYWAIISGPILFIFLIP